MIFCTRSRLMSERLWQTALADHVSINLWKIFTGHTEDWFDVRTASICTTDLWDALKSFILNSLKFKVAPYPIIVSLDTLKFKFKLLVKLPRSSISSNVTFSSSWWHRKEEKKRQKRSKEKDYAWSKMENHHTVCDYIHQSARYVGRNFCGYLILRFFPNRKNSQNKVPANNCSRKVVLGTMSRCASYQKLRKATPKKFPVSGRQGGIRRVGSWVQNFFWTLKFWPWLTTSSSQHPSDIEQQHTVHSEIFSQTLNGFSLDFPQIFRKDSLCPQQAPNLFFWDPKIKQFCFKQVQVDRENVHKNLNSGLKLEIITRKENWGKKMASGVFPENLRKIERETNVL